MQNGQLQTLLSENEQKQIEVFEKGEFRLGRINHLKLTSQKVLNYWKIEVL